jgi:hypothetical protein
MRSVFGKIRRITAVLFCAVLFSIAGGCDNFMLDNGENSFKKNVEDTVWNATAPNLDIQIQAASPSEGLTAPNGRQTVKQKIPFHVQFTVQGAYFGFVRWMAYDAGTMQVMGPGVVEFSSPGDVETDVTIHAAQGNFLIQPLCSDRPAVQSTNPSSYNVSSNAALRNQPFVIKFTKAIDRRSFQFDDLTWYKDTGDGRQFKNINFSTPSGNSLNHFFRAPVFDNDRTVRFSLETQLPANIYVNVTVNRDVHDLSGVTMGNNYLVEYTVGTGSDTDPPRLEFLALAAPDWTPLVFESNNASKVDITASETRDKLSDSTVLADVAKRRYRNTIPLIIIGEDTTDWQNIGGFIINAKQVNNAAGGSVSGTPYQPAGMIPPEQTIVVNPFIAAFTGNAYSGVSGNPVNSDVSILTYVEYDISNSAYFQDGVIELEITLYDQNSLPSTKYLVYVIKDTSAPSVSSPGIGTISPDSSLYFDDAEGKRWFNGAASGFDLESTQTDPLVTERNGYPGSVIPGVPRTHSNAVQWRYKLGSAGTPLSYEQWVGGSPYVITGGLAVSGTYPVYVQLQDDLGNESAWQEVTSINIDTAAPVITAIANTDIVRAAGTSTYTVTLTAADDHTAVKDFTLTITGLNDTVLGADTSGNTFTAANDVVTGNNTGTLVLKKAATPDGSDPKKGSAVFSFTINNVEYGVRPDLSAISPPAPISGNYRLSVKASDKVDNESAVPVTRDFRHDTRAPLVDDALGLYDGYYVINGTSYPNNDTKNAFGRFINPNTPSARYKEFFINERNFRLRADPRDKNPDTGGVGMASAGFAVDAEQSTDGPHYLEYVRRTTGADGFVTMSRGPDSAAMTFADGVERKHMRFNLFVRDQNGNYRFYPSNVTANADNFPDDVSGVVTASGSGSVSSHFGANDFYVYYDGAAPGFNADPELTPGSIVGLPYDTTLAGIGGTGSTAVRFYRPSGGTIELAANSAADKASTDVSKASGLKRWGWSAGGAVTWNNFDPPSNPGSSYDGKETQSTSSVGLTGVKNADGLPAAPAITDFSRLTLYLEDNVGNQSTTGLGSGVEYFILDNTPPVIGTAEAKNSTPLRNAPLTGTASFGSDGEGDGDDGSSKAYFDSMNYDNRLTTGPITIILNNVVEKGAGVHKITVDLTSGNSVVFAAPTGVTVNGTSIPSGNISGSGPYTITLPAPLRFVTGGTITITGFSVDATGHEGHSFTVNVSLEDRVTNAMTAPLAANPLLIGAANSLGSSHAGDADRFTLVNRSTDLSFVYDGDAASYNYHVNGSGGRVNITVPGVTAKSGLAQFELIVHGDYPISLSEINQAVVKKDSAEITRNTYWWIITKEDGAPVKWHYYIRFKPAAGPVFNGESLVIENLKLNGGASSDGVSYPVQVYIHDYLAASYQELDSDPDPAASTGVRQTKISFDKGLPVIGNTSRPGRFVSGGKSYMRMPGSFTIAVEDPGSSQVSRLMAYRVVVTPASAPDSNFLTFPAPNYGRSLPQESDGGAYGWRALGGQITGYWPTGGSASESIPWTENFKAVNNSGTSGTISTLFKSSTDPQNLFFIAADRAGNVTVHNVFKDGDLFDGKVLLDDTPPEFDGNNTGTAYVSTLKNGDSIYSYAGAGESDLYSYAAAVYRVYFRETGSGIKSLVVSGFDSVTNVSAHSGIASITVSYASSTGASPHTITFDEANGGKYPSTSGTNWGYIEITGNLTAGETLKTISVTNSDDVVGNTAVNLPHSRTITRDTTAPSGVTLDLPGGGTYFGGTIQVDYTEAGSGPLSITFASSGGAGGVFVPATTGLTVEGTNPVVGSQPVTGTVTVSNVDANSYRLNLPGDPNLRGGAKRLTIPGTMAASAIVGITDMPDRVGNFAVLDSNASKFIDRDAVPPAFSGFVFTGPYTDGDGKGELEITFTEEHSGLSELRFTGDAFRNAVASSTSAADIEVSVTNDNSLFTVLNTGQYSYTYNSGTTTLKITDPLIIAGQLKGTNRLLKIKGALPGSDSVTVKSVTLSHALDAAGNPNTSPGQSAAITRDTTPPAFSGAVVKGTDVNAQNGWTNDVEVVYTVNLTEAVSGLHTFTVDGISNISAASLGVTDIMSYESGGIFTLDDTVTSHSGSSLALSITGEVAPGSSGNTRTVKISAAEDRAGRTAAGSPGTVTGTSVTVTIDDTKPAFTGAAIRGTAAQDGWTNDNTGVIYTATYDEAHSGLRTFTVDGMTVTAATLSGVGNIMAYHNSGTFTLPPTVDSAGTGLTLTITGTVPTAASGAAQTVKISDVRDRAGNAADENTPGTADNTGATVTFDLPADRPAFSGAAVKGTNANALNGWTNVDNVIYTVNLTELHSGLYTFTVDGMATITAATLGGNNIMTHRNVNTFTLPAGFTSTGTGIILIITGTVDFTGAMPKTVKLYSASDRAGNPATGSPGTVSGASVTITKETAPPAFSGAALAGYGSPEGWYNGNELEDAVYKVTLTEEASGLYEITVEGFESGSLGGFTLNSTSLEIGDATKDVSVSGLTVTFNHGLTTTGGQVLSFTGDLPSSVSGAASATVRIATARDRAGNAAGSVSSDSEATAQNDTTAPSFMGTATLTGYGSQPGFYNLVLTAAAYQVTLVEAGSGLASIEVNGFNSDTLANFKLNNVTIVGASASGSVITIPATTRVTGGVLSFTGTLATAGTATVAITKATDRTGNTVNTPSNTTVTATQDTTAPDFVASSAAIRGPNAQSGWTNTNTGVVYTVNFTEAGSGLHTFTVDGMTDIIAATLGGANIMSYRDGVTFTFNLPAGFVSTGTGVILRITGTVTDAASGQTRAVSLSGVKDRAGNTTAGTPAANTTAIVTFDNADDTPAFVSSSAALAGYNSPEGWYNGAALSNAVYTVTLTEQHSGLYQITVSGFADTPNLANFKLNGGNITGASATGNVITFANGVTGGVLSFTGTLPPAAASATDATVTITAVTDRAGNSVTTPDNTAAMAVRDGDAPGFGAVSPFTTATLAGSGSQPGSYRMVYTNATYQVTLTETGSGLASISVTGFAVTPNLANFKLNDITISGASATGNVITFPNGVTSGVLSFTGTLPSNTSAAVAISAAADRVGNSAAGTVVTDSTATATRDSISPAFVAPTAAIKGTAVDAQNGWTNGTEVTYTVNFTETGSGLYTFTVDGMTGISARINSVPISSTYISGGTVTLPDQDMFNSTGSGITLSITGTVPATASGSQQTVKLVSASDRAGNAAAISGSTVTNTAAIVTFDNAADMPVFSGAAIRGPNAQNGWTNTNTGVVYTVNFTELHSGLYTFTINGMTDISAASLGLTDIISHRDGSTFTFNLPVSVISHSASPLTLSVTGTVPDTTSGQTKTVSLSAAKDRAGNAAVVTGTSATVTFDKTDTSFGAAAITGSGATRPGWYGTTTNAVYEVTLTEAHSGLATITVVSGFSSGTLGNFTLDNVAMDSGNVSASDLTISFPNSLATGTHTLSFTGTLPSGSASISLNATDRAGNTVTGVGTAAATQDTTGPAIISGGAEAADGTASPVVKDYSTGKAVWRFKFTETESGINKLKVSLDGLDNVFSGSTIKYHVSGNDEEYDTTYYSYSTGSYNSADQTITLVNDWITGTDQYLYIAGLLNNTANAASTTLALSAFTDGAGNSASTPANADTAVTIDKLGPTGTGFTDNTDNTVTLAFSDPRGIASVTKTTGGGSFNFATGVLSGLDTPLPGDGTDEWTFTAVDGLGNSRDLVLTITRSGASYNGIWDNSGLTTPPGITLNIASPFTRQPVSPVSSGGSDRINRYYSGLANSGARGTGNTVPVSYTARSGVNPLSPAQNGRTRISYTGASAGTGLRELYRNLEPSSRQNTVPLTEPAYADQASRSRSDSRSAAGINAERNPGDGRSGPENGKTEQDSVVRADNENRGNSADIEGENTAVLGAAAFLWTLPPLVGDTGEDLPLPGRGESGRNGGRDGSFLNPDLKPWNYARKARARRRPNY